tara:strand:+ start:2700 stop:3719 length:1020 start_codon:yes stop_codon:yes gene_type:complete
MPCAAFTAGLASRVTPGLTSRAAGQPWSPQPQQRGALLLTAAKSKRDQERKAAKRAEAKELNASFAAATGDADGVDTGDIAVAVAPSGPAPYEGTGCVMQSLTICGSYKEKCGEKLLDGTVMVQEAAERLFKAPFVCASHDADDVFNYGNQAALSLWGLPWQEFVGMPSTKSAAADDGIQTERRELLDKAAENGVIRNYCGVRQARDGRKFRVEDAIVWTITNKDGEKTGQAVRFDKFTWLNEDGSEGDAMTVAENGKLVPAKSAVSADPAPEATDEPEATDAPSPEAIAAAENAIEEQATEVRRLKDEEGLTNSDPEVQEAVAALLVRKSALASMLFF